MKSLILRVVFLLILILGNLFSTSAQCAMCRAAVENNISEGSAGLSAGLNTGILYLFVTPYLLVALIGFLWYRNSKGKYARTVEDKSRP